MRILLTLFILSLSSLSYATDLDLTASTIKWTGSKPAGTHWGWVKLKSGDVTFDATNNLTGGTFVIDMTTIDCQDQTGTWKEKLDGHLKSADFFDVAKYPTATFTIKKVAKGKTAGTWDVVGDMKIKDITKQITIPATVQPAGKAFVATSKLEINRLDWGVKYNSKSVIDFKKLADKVISDQIGLELNLKTKDVDSKAVTKAVDPKAPVKVKK